MHGHLDHEKLTDALQLAVTIYLQSIPVSTSKFLASRWGFVELGLFRLLPLSCVRCLRYTQWQHHCLSKCLAALLKFLKSFCVGISDDPAGSLCLSLPCSQAFTDSCNSRLLLLLCTLLPSCLWTVNLSDVACSRWDAVIMTAWHAMLQTSTC